VGLAPPGQVAPVRSVPIQQGQSYSLGLLQVPTVPRWWSSSRSLSSSAPRQA
jgi:hypothetical protein